jgi:SAM-dependent methyltransferase
MKKEINKNTDIIIPEEFFLLKKKYQKMGLNPRGFVKFFDEKAQFEQKQSWIDILELNRIPKCRLFDIGSGAGFFPFLVKQIGHTVKISDVPSSVAASLIAYEECIEALGMKKDFSFAVEKQKKLPNIGKYDIISATGVAFHENWEPSDWEFFIKDCFSHLRKNGTLFLHVNNTGKGKEGYDSLKSLKVKSGFWYDEHILIIRNV